MNGDDLLALPDNDRPAGSRPWWGDYNLPERVKEAFDAAGIEIPFPHHTLRRLGNRALPGARGGGDGE